LSGFIGACGSKSANFADNSTLMKTTLNNVGGVLNNPAVSVA